MVLARTLNPLRAARAGLRARVRPPPATLEAPGEAMCGPTAPYFSTSGLRVSADARRAALRQTHSMTTTPKSKPTSSVAFRKATVRDDMTTGVISCSPETPLRNVAALMDAHRVHGIFVFDYGREDDETVELWGLVSDLDVIAAASGDIDLRTAGDSAVAPLLTVTSDTPLERAAQLMAEHSTSHLAVLDPSTHRPVGVLSTLDIARTIAAGAEELKLLASQLSFSTEYQTRSATSRRSSLVRASLR